MIIPLNETPKEHIDQKSFLAGEQWAAKNVLDEIESLLKEIDKTPGMTLSKRDTIALVLSMGNGIVSGIKEVTELYNKTGSIFMENNDGD